MPHFTMEEIGCQPWPENENFDCGPVLQNFFDECEANWGYRTAPDGLFEGKKVQPSLDLQGKHWRVATKFKIPRLLGPALYGGGGWLPRNYGAGHFNHKIASSPSVRGGGVGTLMWGGELGGIMMEYSGSGLYVENVCFAGAIVNSFDSGVWNSGQPQPFQAAACINMIRDAGLGVGKIEFKNVTFRHTDIGLLMVGGQSMDNCIFSGTTTFGNCSEAGVKHDNNNAVNHRYDYIRLLGAASNYGVWLGENGGGNIWIRGGEIIDTREKGALLNIDNTDQANSATFKIDEFKWDTTTDATPTGPMVARVNADMGSCQIRCTNCHLPGSGNSRGDKIFHLVGAVNLVLDTCYNVRAENIYAEMGGTFVNGTPVVTARSCYHANPPDDSIFTQDSTGGIYRWRDAVTRGGSSAKYINGWTLGKETAYHDGEIFLNGVIDQLTGPHIKFLPDEDPQIPGAWYVDAQNFVKISGEGYVRMATTSSTDVSQARTWKPFASTSGYHAPQIVESAALSVPATYKFDLSEVLNPDTGVESVLSIEDTTNPDVQIDNIRIRHNCTDVLFDIVGGLQVGTEYKLTLTFETNDDNRLVVSGALHAK